MESYGERIDSLIAQANEVYKSDLAAYLAFVEEARQLAKDHGDAKRLARCILMRASYHVSKREIDRALQEVAAARELIATLPELEAEGLRPITIKALAQAHFAGGCIRKQRPSGPRRSTWRRNGIYPMSSIFITTSAWP
jgi:hypothetical protein